MIEDDEIEVPPNGGTSPWVTTQQLALRFGMDMSACRKWLVQQAADLGIERVRIRGQGGQNVKAWKWEDAERLVNRRKALGFEVDGAVPERVQVQLIGGVFYLLLIDPLMPLRLKAGYSSDFDQRLGAHRTIAPRLEVLATWSAPPWVERPALAVLAATENAVQVGDEVFDISPELALARLAQFFELIGLGD